MRVFRRTQRDSRALLEAVLAATVFATLALMSVAATVSKRLINNSSRPWLLFGHVASYPRRIYRYRVAYLAGIPVTWPTCLIQFNRSSLICPFIKAIFYYESQRIYIKSLMSLNCTTYRFAQKRFNTSNVLYQRNVISITHRCHLIVTILVSQFEDQQKHIETIYVKSS